MANHLLNKAWKVRLPPKQKLMFVSLADRANTKTGKCFVGMSDHLKRTGLSESSVRRAIHALQRRGQISVQLRTGTSSIYTVHPCQADTPTPVRVTPPAQSQRQDTPVTKTPDSCQGDTQTIKEPSFNPARDRLPDDQRAPRRHDAASSVDDKPFTVAEILEMNPTFREMARRNNFADETTFAEVDRVLAERQAGTGDNQKADREGNRP